MSLQWCLWSYTERQYSSRIRLPIIFANETIATATNTSGDHAEVLKVGFCHCIMWWYVSIFDGHLYFGTRTKHQITPVSVFEIFDSHVLPLWFLWYIWDCAILEPRYNRDRLSAVPVGLNPFARRENILPDYNHVNCPFFGISGNAWLTHSIKCMKRIS